MAVYRSSDRAVIDRSFFQRDPLVCAREMMGCLLVSETTAGRIVETEAYDAGSLRRRR